MVNDLYTPLSGEVVESIRTWTSPVHHQRITVRSRLVAQDSRQRFRRMGSRMDSLLIQKEYEARSGSRRRGLSARRDISAGLQADPG